MTPRSQWWGSFLILTLLAGTWTFVLEGNALGEQDLLDAPSSPTQKFDADLIDQVLSSDYFEDDKEAAKDAPSPPAGSLPVQPEVAEEVEEEVTTSKNPFCVGCPMEVDVDDDKIKEMAGFAFSTHLSGFDDLERAQRMVRVVNAMTQVVAGQKYILDLEVYIINYLID